jgi:hypothetical protein
MSRGASQVEGRQGATRESRKEKNNSIVLGIGRVVEREGGITEETLWVNVSETDGVEVECLGASHVESVLHGGLLGGVRTGIIEPVGVQCPGGARQLEIEPSSAVVLIQDIDLIIDLGIWDITSLQ